MILLTTLKTKQLLVGTQGDFVKKNHNEISKAMKTGNDMCRTKIKLQNNRMFFGGGISVCLKMILIAVNTALADQMKVLIESSEVV